MNLNLFSNSHSDIDEIPSSGIGIKLMGKIADELSYTRTSDGRNCLLIVKYFQPVPPQPKTPARFLNLLNSFNWLQEQLNPQFDPSSSNQPIPKISLQLNSDIKGVTQVLSWIEQFFF